jgi:hypothetical protein
VEEVATQCDICGEEASLSKEHVFPTWLTNALDQESTNVVFARPGRERRWRSQGHLGVTVGGVCTNCNNGWMAQLESDVRPVVTPFIEGAWPSLGRLERATLARWALKTAMVVDLMSKERFFELSDRMAVARQEPLRLSMTIWQGRLLATFTAMSVDYRVWWRHQHGQDLAGLVSTIAVGHALLQTVLVRADDLRGLPFRPKDWETELARLWPTLDTPFPAMPERVISEQRLSAVIDRCRSGV